MPLLRPIAFISFLVLTRTLVAQSLVLGTGSTNTSIAQERALFFDVLPLKHLTIDDFAFDCTVGSLPKRFTIWRKKSFGSYQSSLGNPLDWEVVGDTYLPPSMPAGRHALGLSLGVFVPAGERQAFAIDADLYNYIGPVTGSQIAADANLGIECGMASTYLPAYHFDANLADCAFSGAVYYSVATSLVTDLEVESVRVEPPSSPRPDCAGFGAAESVSIQLRNLGSASLPVGTSIFLSCSHSYNAATALVLGTLTLSQPLLPSATISHVFPGTLDLSGDSSPQLQAALFLPGDLDPTNDNATVTIAAPNVGVVESLPWSEDFNDLAILGAPPVPGRPPIPIRSLVPPPGWTQDPNDSSGPFGNWYFYRGEDPQADVVVGTRIDANGLLNPGPSRPVILSSPCVDLGSAVNPQLVYQFAMTSPGASSTPNSFSVDVLDTATGNIVVDVDGPFVANVYDPTIFERHVVDLSPFAGAVVRLIFRADLGPEGHPGSIPVFDNVVLREAPTLLGQNEQVGFASLYLGTPISAVNAAGDEIYVHSGGPYFFSRGAGEALVFEFRGEPNQPIIFLNGPLNTNAATFGPIGSMDIGGAPDPLTGIPANLNLLGDGNGATPGIPALLSGPTGSMQLLFTMPNLPQGPITTFQAAIFTNGMNGSYIALSNAVQLSAR